ncbi:MAG: MlaA family lipoprotein, partial [Methylocella sp.]
RKVLSTMKTNYPSHLLPRVFWLATVLSLTGCATIVGRDPQDPWEGWNRGVQNFNDSLDDYVMKPVAKGYRSITPSIVDTGITNFFSNIDDIGVIANDLLQFKVTQSGQDLGRLLVNSTLGLAGIVDVASKLDLPKHNEDLDQTLGVWGVPTGPYLVLPLIGPSSPRGVIGVAGDTMTNPINWIAPVMIPWSFGTLKTVDMRADFLSVSKIMEQIEVDHYEFIRNAYFQQRNYLIYDGNPPLDDEFEKDLELEGLSLDSNKTPSPGSGDSASSPGY